MKNRVYYYTLQDALRISFEDDTIEVTPYDFDTFKSFIDDTIGSLQENIKVNFALNDSNVEKMWQDLIGQRYSYHIFFIKKPACSNEEPTVEEVAKKFIKWIYKLIGQVEKTYPYYNTLMVNYTAALDKLMDDLKTSSKNNIKFNDTPQNANTEGVYEGDDYITNFTHTEGETTSPLTTKMLRLKEIQDNFKEVLADWVREVGRVFLTEGDE